MTERVADLVISDGYRRITVANVDLACLAVITKISSRIAKERELRPGEPANIGGFSSDTAAAVLVAENMVFRRS